AMAEYAVMAMLVWSHRYFDIALAFRGGSWRDSGVMNGPLHRELRGLTVGIVGLGQVGRETAIRAAALGCHVVGANRTIGEPPQGRCGAQHRPLYPRRKIAACRRAELSADGKGDP